MNKKIVYFILAILVQALIVAAVPAKQVYTILTGKLITIKTAPYDPYDFLSGYHVVLRYEISNPAAPLIQAKHRDDYGKKTTVYVVLEEDVNNIWQVRSVHDTWPENIPLGSVIIKGVWVSNGIQYGIESYFIPENSRKTIETDLRENLKQAKAQIKIDSFGNAALIRLLVGDRVYEY
jgi:uncharacterized membrane-anchored protein